MRVSTYEIIVPLPNERKALLIHGLFGTVDLVSEKVANEIIKHRKSFSIEHLFPAAIQDQLMQRHHLTMQSDEQEIAVYRSLAYKYESLNKSRDESPKFVILLTYGCNLRCTYCYQKGLEDRVQPAANPVMSPQQAARCLDIIDRFPVHPDKTQIELFGGEPLSSETYSTVECIVKRASASGRQIAVTSNCFELDLFSKMLGPGMIEDIIVTVDGPAPVHNQRRPALHGYPTFDRISRNIDLALSNGVRIFLRVNLDKSNLQYLSELADYVGTKGWIDNPKFTMYHALIKSFPGKKKPDTVLDISDVFKYLEDNDPHSPALARVGEKVSSLISSFIIGDQLPTSHTRTCGAVGTSLYLSPDGLIYGCHEAVGQPTFAIGYYDEDLHLSEKELSKWRSRRLPSMNACERCPYVMLCAGGCAYRAIAQGDPMAPICDDFHESFVLTMQRERRLMSL